MPDGELSNRVPRSEDEGIRVVILNSFGAVRTGLGHLTSFLGDTGIDAGSIGTMELVVAEALNNIVEHAYGDEQGIIEITASPTGSSVQFCLKDQGTRMPDDQVPLGEFQDFPSDPLELPEGGFGWFLIHDLTDGLTYERNGKDNVLRFSVEIGG